MEHFWITASNENESLKKEITLLKFQHKITIKHFLEVH